MVQTYVNIEQAYGQEGALADDSAHRATNFPLVSSVGGSAKASGSISFTGNLSAGDTITIGGTTLTAVASGATGDQFDVGADLGATLATIAGKSVADVVLAANATTLIVVAEVAGDAGNAITLATSVSSATVSGMAGGSDAVSNPPVLARFYTLDASGKAVMGGNGVQLGIALNNGQVALFGGLNATLAVPENTQADVCSFGHVFVKVLSDFAVGDGAAFDTITGEVYAFNGTAPAGTIAIEGAAFITKGGLAGEIGILSLNGK